MGLGLGEAICRIGGRDADFNLRTEKLADVDRDEAQARIAILRRMSGERWRGSDGEVSEAPPRRKEEPRKAVEVGRPEPVVQTSRPPPDKQEPVGKAQEKRDPQPQLDKETLDYLELVATEPFLTVRERNEYLGLTAWKGGQTKKTLLDGNRQFTVGAGGAGGS